jgi:hypothetical protein
MANIALNIKKALMLLISPDSLRFFDNDFRTSAGQLSDMDVWALKALLLLRRPLRNQNRCYILHCQRPQSKKTRSTKREEKTNLMRIYCGRIPRIRFVFQLRYKVERNKKQECEFYFEFFIRDSINNLGGKWF